MDFTFEYQIAGKVETVVVKMADAVVMEAKKAGVEAVALESEAKAAVDAFIGKVTGSRLWQKVVTVVEHDAAAVAGAVEQGATDVVDAVSNAGSVVAHDVSAI